MPPKKRKCTTGVTVERRSTRLQARLNATPTPKKMRSSSLLFAFLLIWRLEDMEDAKLKIKKSSSLKEEKNKCNELVEELETKLKDCTALSSTLKDMINEEKRKLQLYEAKFQELQEHEKSTMKILEKAQAKSTKLNQIASDVLRSDLLLSIHWWTTS